jgi:cell division protein FtsI (penicillin-binding protein 3)
MASDKAIKMMTMLYKSRRKRNSKKYLTPNLKLQEKQEQQDSNIGKRTDEISSSFAGFYPADNPKYTCM